MKNTSLQMPSLKKALLLAGVAVFAVSAPAYAGFEWKGPLEAPHAAAPEAAPEADNMAPVASSNNPPPMSPMVPPPMHTVPHGDQSFKPVQPPAAPITQNANQQAAQDLAPVDMTPAPEAAAPVAAAPVAAAPMADATPQGEVLSGFGKDVPLVIALQQVVPAGYQYSFGAGVNPGVSVSWEGGKPWQQVLSDMLAAQSLGYKIQNNAVVIGNFPSDVSAQSGAAAMTPAPEAAAAAPAQDDMSPVSITSAPAAAAPAPAAAPAATPAAAPAKEDGVTIHREKKKSLLERLGWKKSESEESDSAQSHEAMTKAEARNASDSMPSAPAKPAGEVVVSPSTSTAYSAPETGKVTASNGGDAFSGAHDSALTAPPAGATPVASDSQDNQPERLSAAPTAEASAAPAASTPAAVTGEWTGQKGQTLREVLKSWSDKAGVDLYWSIDYDYRLSDNASFNGDYDQAVAGLLDRFATVRPQPYGQLHKSAGGPRVLVVKSYDLSK